MGLVISWVLLIKDSWEATGVNVMGEALVGEGEDETETIEFQEPEGLDAVNALPTPTLPSQSEIEQHEIDHIPHENWCEYCVSVFGREQPHVASTKPRDIPIISLDYCFLSRRGVFARGEWVPLEGETALKI